MPSFENIPCQHSSPPPLSTKSTNTNPTNPQEVQSMQFNILVTTYETIMRDRTKLSKLEWKYIIIDEAQRMKDRESKLSQVSSVSPQFLKIVLK
jgi:SNF2 family DNA or RNA helicase